MGNLNKLLVGTVLVALLQSLSLSVFAQTAKPSAPEFTAQYLNQVIVVKIKNIDFDLPTNGSYHIRYNVRLQSNVVGSTWSELYQDFTSPVQDASGYTTITSYAYYESATGTRVNVEVQALVCHNDTEIGTPLPPPFDDMEILTNVTKIDSRSEWSNPQSLTLDTNGSTGIPTSVMPDPTASTTQGINQLNVLLDLNWEKVALAAMAAVIAVLAMGLVLLWRKVGNLANQKRPQENST